MNLRPTAVSDSSLLLAELSPASADSSPSFLTARVRLGGRYEILGLIGSGGMGNVYRARDLELGEVVALKMLSAALLAEPAALERFRREVRLARRVTHHNVARVFDIGEHEGKRFLTMELIDGAPLGSQLEVGRGLPPARAVAIAAEICAGLAAAHAAGVIHRDLKPDNVLIANDGRVVITDFGVARPLGPEAGVPLNTGGFAVGTPEYMAPEQVQALPDIDGRADLYALGVMLYEMLTGLVPWTGASAMAVLTARLTSPVPDPRVRVPSLWPALVQLVMALMATQREQRPPSADLVRERLVELERQLQNTAATVVLPATPRPEAGAAQLLRVDTPARPATISSVWPTEPPTSDTLSDKSVAILPFRNAGNPEDDYLADGLTEDLIDTLSMTGGLRVRPRGMVMPFKDKAMDPRKVGIELDVQVIVEGTLRRTITGLRIGVRIVSVGDGFQLWAQRYQRAPEELFAVSDEMAEAIAEALTARAAPPSRGPVPNAEAMDLYLRARHAYHMVADENRQQAIALFEQALQRAPDDPTILAGYAMAAARRAAWEDEGLEQAREIAERACAVAPDAGDPLLARATVRMQEGQLVKALADLGRALRVFPDLPEAHWLLGRLLVEADIAEPGEEHLERALSLDPSIAVAYQELGRSYALRGRRDKLEQLAANDPFQMLWLVRAREVFWRRDALRAAALSAALPPTAPLAAYVRALLDVTCGAASAPMRESLSTFAPSDRSSWRKRAFYWQMQAELHAFVGDAGAALHAVERAVDAGLIDLMWLDRCPLFTTLRSHPEMIPLREAVVARAVLIRAGWNAMLSQNARRPSLPGEPGRTPSSNRG